MEKIDIELMDEEVESLLQFKKICIYENEDLDI